MSAVAGPPPSQALEARPRVDPPVAARELSGEACATSPTRTGNVVGSRESTISLLAATVPPLNGYLSSAWVVS